MARGDDKNNHLKQGTLLQKLLVKPQSRHSTLFHLKKKKKKKVWRVPAFTQADVQSLGPPAFTVRPGLISQAAGPNQAHAWLLKQLC